MPKFIGTFGSNHGYAQCYTVIEAETREAAIDIMRERYGSYWSEVYDYDKKEKVADVYNLIEIEPGVRPDFQKFSQYNLQSWLIERGIPFEHTDDKITLANLAEEYWEEN